MAAYSTNSANKLGTCHEDLQTVFEHVIEHFDNTIVCGHRGEEEQNYAKLKGYSQLGFPYSKHNGLPSMAVDSVPYPIDWKDTLRMRYYAGFVVGIAHLLYDAGIIHHLVRAGIDWDKDTETKDNRFDDYPHFELYKPKD